MTQSFVFPISRRFITPCVHAAGKVGRMTRLLLRRFCGTEIRLLAMFLLGVAGMRGQTSPAPSGAPPAAIETDYVPTMTFDVASIHESPMSNSFIVSFQNPPHSSLLRLTNNNLMNLISIAYGVRWEQISGVPDWGKWAHFMVEAKCDSEADEKLAKLPLAQAKLEKQHMLQALLADRFQLKVAWQTKEGTIYDLVVEKNGPKFGAAKSESPTPEEKAKFGDHPIPPIYQKGDGRLGYRFIAHGATMSMLADNMAGQMGTDVLDKTGLAGTYDFTLEYSGTIPGTGSRDPDAWPLLIEALPEQLGLKLQPAKGPIKMLVIERVERPSAN